MTANGYFPTPSWPTTGNTIVACLMVAVVFTIFPVEDEGPNLLKLVLDQHAQKLKKILEDEFSSIAAAAAIAPAPAPDAMDTSSDQPPQPAAAQALDRAKTKIAETCERHQEMVLQLFHAERMVLEWRAHGFMQAGAEGEEDPAAAPAPPAPAPAPAQQ